MPETLERFRDITAAGNATSMLHGLGVSDVSAVAKDQPLAVERIDAASYVGMQAAFDDLASRADAANPFMSPAMVAASLEQIPAASVVVLTCFDPADSQRLIGVWCLKRQRDLWSLCHAVLQTTLVPRYECLAAPVLDKARQEAALHAMLAYIRQSADLPKIIRATSWPTQLNGSLPSDARIGTTETWQRAMLRPLVAIDAESYLRRAMGKALNKRNNRQKQLAELGRFEIVTTRGTAAIAAFEHYITLEQRGWKGQAGTSLAEVPADALYMRAAVRQMADADQIAIDMLQLEGRVIAAGVVVEAHGNNLFWKAAFDEDYSRFAPGSLLHLAVTRRLFTEGRASLDSCMMAFTSPDFLPWSERAAMARIMIDQGAGFGGVMVRCGERLRHAARRLKLKFKPA